MAKQLTIKQWIAMMFLETGERYTVAQAKACMSVEREHEAEAIAGGRDDVDPDTARLIQVAKWNKQAFQVYRHHVRYCPYTDGMIGNASYMVGGFDTREQAESFILGHYCSYDMETADNEFWFTVQPEKIRELLAVESMSDVPF